MKERPILFNGPMVNAILAGRKKQTRRIVKPQPEGMLGVSPWWKAESDPSAPNIVPPCPFGQPGDLLWVRETFSEMVGHHRGLLGGNYAYKASMTAESERCRQDYIKAGYPYQWTPSIHMPRAASRITLEISAVRVERLKEISEEDARAEGITSREIAKKWGREVGWCADWSRVGRPSKYAENGITAESDICLSTARHAFANLWEFINGPGSWDANPWVWVVEFQRVEVPHA